MSTEQKLDQVLQDIAVVKTKLDAHTTELHDLKQKIEPVLYHVNGVRWAVKIGVGIIGVLSCVAGIVALLR